MNLFMKSTEMGFQQSSRSSQTCWALVGPFAFTPISSQTISPGFRLGECGSCAGSACLHFSINPQQYHQKSTLTPSPSPPPPLRSILHGGSQFTFCALHKDTAGETKDLKFGFFTGLMSTPCASWPTTKLFCLFVSLSSGSWPLRPESCSLLWTVDVCCVCYLNSVWHLSGH